MKRLLRSTLVFVVLFALAFLAACPGSNVQGDRANSPAARTRQQQGDQSESQSSSGNSQQESSSDEDWLEDI